MALAVASADCAAAPPSLTIMCCVTTSKGTYTSWLTAPATSPPAALASACLLYTSDAADDM
eukprot:5104094-Prymnesium_polylepis.2